MMNTYDRLSPTPRLCIDSFLDSTLEEYDADIQNSISNKNAFSLSLDELSHKVCLVSRKDRRNMGSPCSVRPITPSIQSRLAGQL